MLCIGFIGEADSIVPEVDIAMVIGVVVAGRWLLLSRRRFGASFTFECV